MGCKSCYDNGHGIDCQSCKKRFYMASIDNGKCVTKMNCLEFADPPTCGLCKMDIQYIEPEQSLL